MTEKGERAANGTRHVAIEIRNFVSMHMDYFSWRCPAQIIVLKKKLNNF